MFLGRVYGRLFAGPYSGNAGTAHPLDVETRCLFILPLIMARTRRPQAQPGPSRTTLKLGTPE
jgi:hypothetical protein